MVCLGLLTMLAYASSLRGGYVYEDLVGLVPWQGWPGEAWQFARWPVRSLPRFTWLLTPGWATADRVVNLCWHLLNGVLLWRVAVRRVSAGAAVVAVGLFWLLPIQTETVAYVASRPELIAATCVLLALLAVERGRIVLAGGCCVGAVLARELAVTAFLLVPLWAWWSGQQWPMRLRVVWGVTIGALALGVLVQINRSVLLSSYAWSPWYVAGQLAAAIRMLVLVPESLIDGTALTIDHDWSWFTKPAALAAVVLWLGAVETAWRFRWPLWGFALLFTLAALSLRLLVQLPDGLHERHLYTPLMAISLALGAAVTGQVYGRSDSTARGL